MAKEPDQISPEEKLLNVIQKGEAEKKGKKAPPAVAAVSAAPAPATAPAAVSEKARLSLAKDSPKAQPRQDPAGHADPASPAPSGDGRPAPPAAPAQRFRKANRGQAMQQGLGFGLVNTGLIAVAVIMVALTALQIHAGVASFRTDQQTAVLGPAGGKAPAPLPVPEVPDISAFIAALGGRTFFPSQSGATNGPGPVAGGWGAEVRDNVNMIGISRVSGGNGELEAILVDKRDGKMHLAKTGDTFVLGKLELKVDQVSGEETILTDGTEKVSVRPGMGKK